MCPAESRGGHTGYKRARGAGRATGRVGCSREAEGGGRLRCTQRAGGRVRLRIGGQRAGSSTPSNILRMSVTREVSQPEMSALKSFAACRGGRKSRAHGAGRAAGRGAREGGGGRARCARGVPRGKGCYCRYRGKARGAAHVKHGVHVRDAGGVPVQRLVEGPSLLPRVASRAHGAGRTIYGPGGGRRAGEGATADCGGRVAGRRAAHEEHVVHIHCASRVEVERLVEHPGSLPRIKRRESMCVIQYGARGNPVPQADRRAGGLRDMGTCRPTRLRAVLDACASGAHVEHFAHDFDLRGVDVKRLVEGFCELPRAKKGGHARERVLRRKSGIQVWGGGARRAHLQHLVHGCDPRCVKAQWLVELERVLPNRERMVEFVCAIGGREEAGCRRSGLGQAGSIRRV